MAQVAVAWSLSKDIVSAPIVGTTNLNNLKEMIGTSSNFARAFAETEAIGSDAVQIKLSEEEIKYLEEPYKPTEIFGHQ